MEILEQLNINDIEISYHITKYLKEKWPQINKKTKITYINADHVEKVDFDSKEFIEKCLKPHHDHLREDIKEEIRNNLNSVINDKNYLMKIAEMYYQNKVSHYTTKIYHLEYLSYIGINSKFNIGVVYLPNDDTLYVKNLI